MKASQIKAVMLGLTGLMAVTSLQAADIEAGKAKTALCGGCHGADGNSVNVIWPRLAGQNASYLVKQLMDFKSGKRADATMQGMAGTLSDEDVINVAAYYETQKPTEAKFNEELLAKGETIYRGGITDISASACIGCHSPDGSGNADAKFPALQQQHPEYIAAQLMKFKNGTRANDAGLMMRNIAKRMSEEEMNAVSAYVAALK